MTNLSALQMRSSERWAVPTSPARQLCWDRFDGATEAVWCLVERSQLCPKQVAARGGSTGDMTARSCSAVCVSARSVSAPWAGTKSMTLPTIEAGMRDGMLRAPVLVQRVGRH